MGRGLIKTEAYFENGQDDRKPRKGDKNLNCAGDQPSTEMKLSRYSAILITTIFVFTGMIVFLNINQRVSLIDIQILFILLTFTILPEKITADLDDSFTYVVNDKNDEKRRKIYNNGDLSVLEMVEEPNGSVKYQF